MRKINCTKGTPEQMLDAFKNRLDELDGIGIDSSFDYPDDLEDLENGEYESHATEPVNASVEDGSENNFEPFPVQEVLNFLENKGYDVNSREVKSYAEAVAEYMDTSKAAWSKTGNRWPYSLNKWYEDTRLNYPDELEELPKIDACDAIMSSDNGPVKLHVEFEVYGRYGDGGQHKKANVSGDTLLEALCNMVDRMGLYIDSDEIIEEGMTADEVLSRIEGSNGDGCDFIYYLENKTTGEVLMDYRDYYEDEEEDWD